MQLTTKQTNIAKQKRDDDLFQIRLDTYNKIISFCADVVIKYDRLREHYSNRHEVGSHMAKKEIGKVLLAQVEYLFSKQVAQWLKNTCTNSTGYPYTLGSINDITGEFVPSKELVLLFEPFLQKN